MDSRLARFALTNGFVCLAFIGCSWFSSKPTGPQKQVTIVSNPPGSRIEVNGKNVGVAPVNVYIDASSDGRFKKSVVIKAYPLYSGYLQIKVFNAKSHRTTGDMIPSRIDLDTRIEPGATSGSVRNEPSAQD